jgi:hypothetical protein
MKIYLKKSITLIVALLFCASFLYAEGLEKGKNQLKGKTSGSPSNTRLNINNISTWVYDNGNSDVTSGGDAGFVYPKGSGKTAFFESGPVWGGSMAGYYTIGGSAYRQGLTPGRILESGVADNPENDNVRIYRVRSDYKNFTDAETMTNLFAAEMKDEGMTAEQVYAQYVLDWQQWPAAWGAPFIDKDGDGIYNPDKDIPGVSEEPCQTIWWVANDLDPAVTQYMYGGLPLKVECQATFFAFNTTGPLGNTMFRKYKLINKNTVRFDSVYFCMWSDPDLGGGFDDYTGCDTTLSLGFVFNSDANDEIYGTTPPASGFDFFQGPRVPGEPGDSAKYLGKYVHGYKGLGMTSFFYFSQNVEVDFQDPTQGSYAAVRQWRNMFEGKKSRSGEPYTDPHTGLTTKFPLSGDPVAKTGWIDGDVHVTNDRRFGQVSGPFTMNAGDTQEVVVGQLVAGGTPGIGNLSAVSILKFYDKSAQAAYDNDFKVATPPNPPTVKVSEFPSSIILSWSDLLSYQKTETFAKAGFTFQGYNVYQLPSASSTIATAVRVATYDIVDGISTIVSPTVDETAGAIVTKVTAFGTDSGIKRSITISDDKVRGIAVLYPGTKYYFAVTAYAYSPDPNAVPNVLESTLQILTCTPQSTEPGVRLTTTTGDALSVTHTAGNSEGVITTKVIDPKRGDGNTYTITFPDETHYNILQGTTVMFANMPVQGISNDNPIVAGTQVHVAPPPGEGLKSTSMVSGSNPWSTDGTGLWFVVGWHNNLWKGALQLGYDFWANGTYGSGNYGSSLTSFSQFHDVLLKFATTDDAGNFSASDENASKGYRFMRACTVAPVLPSYAPFIHYTTNNYGFQEFGLNGGPNIPIAAYDQLTGKRLDVACFENNVAGGYVNGIYNPPLAASAGGSGNGTIREAFFILNTEYSETAKPELSQIDREVSLQQQYGPMPFMYWIDAPRVKNFNSADQILISAYKIYSTADSYKFTVPAPSIDANTAKEDVNNVNVYPNPYYGVNAQEINKYQRFVTFTHLPAKATIKIFNIAGQLVRTLEKDATGQYMRWDLASDSGLPVASGIYVAYIDMPDQGVVKKLKVAIIQEQQYLDRF